MKLPSKLFSYEESIFSKFPLILKILRENPIRVKELYYQSLQHFDSITEFVETLDALYALDKIEYANEKEVLNYVD